VFVALSQPKSLISAKLGKALVPKAFLTVEWLAAALRLAYY